MRLLHLGMLTMIIILASGSCTGGVNPRNVPVAPAHNVPGILATGLPVLSSLDSTKVKRATDVAQRLDGWPGGTFTSDNAEHNSTLDSVILHSGPQELSYAMYGAVAAHYVKNVPYLAPYSVSFHTTNAGEFWIALADYGRGTWEIVPHVFTMPAGGGTATVTVGLQQNSANESGAFWCAAIAYGGSAPEIDYVDLAYPDVPAVGQPVDYHQFIYARDGVRLATDVYLPYAEAELAIPDPPYPVLLLRTPYDKAGIASWIVPTLTQANIAVVIQYFRGRLEDEPIGGWPEVWPYSWPDSEGEETLFRDHCGPAHYDAIDTVEWIEQRPWYNGELILSGYSATGSWIYQAASQLGDRVTAIYPQFCAGDMGEWGMRTNGCYRRSNVEGLIEQQHYPASLIDQVEANLENEAYWDTLDYDQYAGGANCPGYHETGWYDLNVDATIKSWRELNENGGPGASGNQWLIIGPWTHDAPRGRTSGAYIFADDLSLHDPAAIPAGWDGARWILNEIGRWPLAFTAPTNRVLVFIIGDRFNDSSSQWYEFADWPPPPESERVRYLNSLTEDVGHGLMDDLPAGGLETFTTDPRFPIPTVGGANLPFAGVIEAGPMAQDPVIGIPGVLDFYNYDDMGPWHTYYVGQARVVLFVSTDAADTDISIKLAHGDAEFMLIKDTMVRLSSYLADHGLGPVVSDTIYELDIDLGAIAVSMDFTEEVHLLIQGTNYPRYDINPGNGDPIYDGTNGVVQTTTIYYGGTHPSRLILPEIEPPA